MKKILWAGVFVALAGIGGQALAANAECDAKATEKKLAGAAKTSFLKKCEKDAAGGGAAASPAAAACEKSATDKKLHGAAAKAHIKKCTADAAASAPKS